MGLRQCGLQRFRGLNQKHSLNSSLNVLDCRLSKSLMLYTEWKQRPASMFIHHLRWKYICKVCVQYALDLKNCPSKEIIQQWHCRKIVKCSAISKYVESDILPLLWLYFSTLHLKQTNDYLVQVLTLSFTVEELHFHIGWLVAFL